MNSLEKVKVSIFNDFFSIPMKDKEEIKWRGFLVFANQSYSIWCKDFNPYEDGAVFFDLFFKHETSEKIYYLKNLGLTGDSISFGLEPFGIERMN